MGLGKASTEGHRDAHKFGQGWKTKRNILTEGQKASDRESLASLWDVNG